MRYNAGRLRQTNRIKISSKCHFLRLVEHSLNTIVPPRFNHNIVPKHRYVNELRDSRAFVNAGLALWRLLGL